MIITFSDDVVLNTWCPIPLKSAICCSKIFLALLMLVIKQNNTEFLHYIYTEHPVSMTTRLYLMIRRRFCEILPIYTWWNLIHVCSLLIPGENGHIVTATNQVTKEVVCDVNSDVSFSVLYQRSEKMQQIWWSYHNYFQL